MLIGEICNRDVIVMTPKESVVDAARLMREHHVGSIIVADKPDGEREPLGMLTDRDVAIEIVARDVAPDAVTVGDAMSQDLLVLTESEGLLDGLRRMRERGIRRAPVVNQHGGLVGIITLDDILEIVAEQLFDVVNLMNRGQRRERHARP
ncbi:MAG: CBS domain-containing protein [Chromatiales bacterium]|nr:MAG: CBS domain-containing protein [Chromatiales bacterium]